MTQLTVTVRRRCLGQLYWIFEAKPKKDDSPLSTNGRKTQVYLNKAGEWQIVDIHYSGMPVSGERPWF